MISSVHPLGWALLTDPMEVLPFNDVRMHALGATCWCLPDVDDDGAISHNAADGRELYIEGRRKFN